MQNSEPQPAPGFRFYLLAALWGVLVLAWLWWIWGPSVMVGPKPGLGLVGLTLFGGHGLLGVFSFFPKSTFWHIVIRALVTACWFASLVMLFTPGKNALTRMRRRGCPPGSAIIGLAIAWTAVILAILALALSCLVNVLDNPLRYIATWTMTPSTGPERFFYIAPAFLVTFSICIVVINSGRSYQPYVIQLAQNAWSLSKVSVITLATTIVFLHVCHGFIRHFHLFGIRPWEVDHRDSNYELFYTCFFVSATTFIWAFGASLIARVLRPRVMALPDNQPVCINCGYDLRGSIVDDRAKCPECGSVYGGD